MTARETEREVREVYRAAWERGLTLREISELTGIGESLLSRWLADGGRVSKIDTLDRLRAAAVLL